MALASLALAGGGEEGRVLAHKPASNPGHL